MTENSEYTPTTEQVREFYFDSAVDACQSRLCKGAHYAEFDRWFAAEKAKWQADAWDEGQRAGLDAVKSNPYRKEDDR